MRTIAEWEALTGSEALTPAEVKLIAAVRAGEPCILNDRKRPTAPSPATKVRAKLLRLLITGASPSCGTQDYGVWLEGAWITGILDLKFSLARGRTVLDNSHFVDQPRLDQSDLNELAMNGSHLPGLFAQGVRVSGNLFLRGVKAKGTVDVNGAKVGGQLDCTGAKLDGAEGNALHAQGVETGQSLFLRGVKAKGTVDVNGGKVGGQFACEGADFDGSGGKALNLQGVQTELSLFLSGVKAKGTVTVNAAKVGGQVVCTDAELDGAGGMALNAQGVETGRDLFLGGVKAKGTVDVSAAKVGGQLDCEGAEFDGAGETALIAQRLHVTEGFFWRTVTVTAGEIDLTAAYVGDLADYTPDWLNGPDELSLDGFTYDRIIGVTGAAARLPWLRAGSLRQGEFLPQPYTQLARVFRAMGHDRQARIILLERDQRLAEQARRDMRVRSDGRAWLVMQNPFQDLRFVTVLLWDFFARLIVGYGHAPQRALWASLALILPSAFLYAHAYAMGTMVPNSDVILTSPGWWWSMWQGPQAPTHVWATTTTATHYETFYSLAYAFDVFVPLVDIGQDRAWSATTVTWLGWGVRVWTMVLEVLGWIVTALGAAAITGIMQRDRE